ncbi:hypothetical protein RFI_27201 [Reticulomyxa filosa]|uniref:Uncharacterized protein n=1 Tax=Reticulomyxa filosa TaxID=46433 RepID=X6M8C7_RETFI|nr:hypothetical protein RFI_27201 [Reticulomyxa filosa]|eukprot:ETO10174.1 hypothetical protein RFI_27201 [Reticulomyxa filosa]
METNSINVNDSEFLTMTSSLLSLFDSLYEKQDTEEWFTVWSSCIQETNANNGKITILRELYCVYVLLRNKKWNIGNASKYGFHFGLYPPDMSSKVSCDGKDDENNNTARSEKTQTKKHRIHSQYIAVYDRACPIIQNPHQWNSFLRVSRSVTKKCCMCTFSDDDLHLIHSFDIKNLSSSKTIASIDLKCFFINKNTQIDFVDCGVTNFCYFSK